MLNHLLDLIFPRACVGCAAWDQTLCAVCAGAFGADFVRVDGGAPYLRLVDGADRGDISPFPVWALVPYQGVPAKAIVAWKHRADARLDDAMARLLPPLSNAHLLFPALGGAPVTVIPAPSAPKRQRDGRFVTGVLARKVAILGGWRYADVLRKPRTLPHRFRVAQLADRAAKQRTRATRHIDSDVILVDDVLTTGATLLGAARAVTSAGGRTIGAIVLAAAADPRNTAKQ